MPDNTWRACYSAPGSVERGSGELFFIYCMPYRALVLYSISISIINKVYNICSCCMCACGTTYARRSLAVRRQLTTHTRARREPAQHHRSAHPWPTLHSAPAPCCAGLNSCCMRGRHSLAASRGLQPEITALARRGRNTFDSPLAMMHTRRSSAHARTFR